MQNIKMLAYGFLLTTQIDALPVTLEKLESELVDSNFVILPYSKAEQISQMLPDSVKQDVTLGMETNKGITIALGELTIILFSDDLSYGERLLVVAHEIGHKHLKHRRSGAYLYGSGKNDKHEEEAQAFAYYLLAPPCILREIGSMSIDRIALLTGLDRGSAAVVFDMLQRESVNNPIAQEKELLLQFDSFVRVNKSIDTTPNALHKRITAALSVTAIVVVCMCLILLSSRQNKATPATPVTQVTPVTAATATPTTGTDDVIVWKSKTGTVYHTDPNCYHINKTAFKMTLTDAINAGYTQCKNCK